MKSNLEEYFKKNQEKGIFDHVIRATDNNENVIFYIHPKDADGETLDFTVTGNELKQFNNEGWEVKQKTSGVGYFSTDIILEPGLK